jgi:hypothetical protein
MSSNGYQDMPDVKKCLKGMPCPMVVCVCVRVCVCVCLRVPVYKILPMSYFSPCL